MQLKEVFFKMSFFYNFLSVNFLMKLIGKKYIHVFYHFVQDDENDLVNNLYQAKNKKQFQEDILFLKNNFSALNINNFTSPTKENHGFLISFDDGLSNFYSIVAPILIAQNLTAINFLNSDFIGNKSLFYRYKVNLLLNEVLNKTFSKEQEKQIIKLLNIHHFTKKIIINCLKETKIKNVLVIDEIAKILDFSFDDFLKKNTPYLTKDQISKLQSKGFYFGAHSKSHPRFSEISLDEQIKETIESVNIIKKQFNPKNNFFSFPFSDDGVTQQFFRKINDKDIVTFGSSGLKDEGSKKHYQRIQMEYKKRIYSAETIVKGELVYYFFKKLLSKHKTIRIP